MQTDKLLYFEANDWQMKWAKATDICELSMTFCYVQTVLHSIDEQQSVSIYSYSVTPSLCSGSMSTTPKFTLAS